MLTPAHFDRWLALFFENIDELFEGEKAEDVKYRAYSIATIMNNRVQQINEQLPIENWFLAHYKSGLFWVFFVMMKFFIVLLKEY